MAQKTSWMVTATLLGAALLTHGAVHAADEEAAKALARQNSCLKCHSVDKEKEGPAFKKIAEKYKGNAKAEAKLIEHLAEGGKAKFPDGHEEDHKVVKTTPAKDLAQIKNLVQWILAQ